MIKLIAADVDNTLVKEGTGWINPEYFDVIRALREEGVMFAAASGRNVVSISRLFEPVKDLIGMISCSGAIYWKYGKPHVISSLDYADLTEIEKQVKQIEGAGLAVDTPDRVIMQPGQDEVYRFLSEGYGNNVVLTENGVFPKDETYVKIEIYHRDRIEEVTRDLVRKWEKRLHPCLAGGVWLDIIPKGCSKGTALSFIQEDLGITSAETAAFGDNGNDLEMLSLAGESYAVENARPEVKQAADHVIGPWQEDSVLREMKRILAEIRSETD